MVGLEVGPRSVEIDDRLAILYALAVGATAPELVWKKHLRVLPTLATALGLWVVEEIGDSGYYDRSRSLHVGQSLDVLQPLVIGTHPMTARVEAVWDKEKATVLEIVVEAAAFRAGYSIYLPGVGGWGGERGPAGERIELSPTWESSFKTQPDQALLHRLTGDRHPVHVDQAAAQAMGLERPILHGLCTLGIAARQLAESVDAHPADLSSISARLSKPVYPGDNITVRADDSGRFDAVVGDRAVLVGGTARYSVPSGQDGSNR